MTFTVFKRLIARSVLRSQESSNIKIRRRASRGVASPTLHWAVPARRAVCLEPLEDRVLLSGTDFSLPGPYSVGEQELVINRTAGDSGSFDAKIFYPATSSGVLTPLDASGGPYPVVSFAHGYLTDARAEYSETARHLASHGYLVVLPSSYESFLDVFEAESLGHDGASGFNYLVAQNGNPSSPYYLAVDTSGYAAMGHSMGGAASISEASQNASVKTIITWAAQNMVVPSAPDQIPNVHVPIQMIAGTQDAIVSSSTTSTIFNSATAPIVLNNLIGGFHFGFEDVGDSIFADSGSMPRATQLGYSRALSVEWLQLYMKGDQSVWRDLWGPESMVNSEIATSLRSRIDVTTPFSSLTGAPGSAVEYSLTVTNTGVSATSYSLFVEDNTWSTTFSSSQTPLLGPGQSATVMVEVQLPSGLANGLMDDFLVSARNNTDGGTRAYTQLQLTVFNTPPVANAGGPYAIAEGGLLTLDATATFDPDLSDVLTFSWDVNGDDTFGDVTGVSPTLDWTTLASLGIGDGPTSWNVRVQVDDGAGNVVVSPAVALAVNNAAPTLSFGGSNPIRGETSTFTFIAFDPSSFDNAQAFTYEIDWNGDEAFDETIIGANSVDVNHLFDTEGFVDVRARVSDHNGAMSDIQTLTVYVLGRDLIEGTLYWYGTSGDDEVRFEQIAPLTVRILSTRLNGAVVSEMVDIPGVSMVHALGRNGADWIDASLVSTMITQLWGGDGQDTITGGDMGDLIYGDSDGGEGAADSIEGGSGDDLIHGDGAEGALDGADTIHGGAGNDTIVADGSEGASDIVYGDGGNDVINTGGDNDYADGGIDDDIVLGADGAEGANDTLLGGDGRDVLVGDGGVLNPKKQLGGEDSLNGGLGEDIVLAGYLLLTDPSLLTQIQATWLSSDTYLARVDAISGVGGPPLLDVGVNVFDDGQSGGSGPIDTVLGGDDPDWLLVDTADDIFSDVSVDELVTDLSFDPLP